MLLISVMIQGILLGLWMGIVADIAVINDVNILVMLISSLLSIFLGVPIVSSMTAFVSMMWLCCCVIGALIGLSLFERLIDFIF